MVASQSLEKCEVAKNLIIHICLMVVMVILIGCDFDFPVPGKVLCFKGFHVCRMMVILIACNFDFPVPGKVLFYEQIHCLMFG